jgi:hypothetical protein
MTLGAQPDRMNAQADLNKVRTFALPRMVNGTASANFFVMLSPDGKIEAKFVSGTESLKAAEKVLTRVNYKFVFPDHGPERIAYNALLGLLSIQRMFAGVHAPVVARYYPVILFWPTIRSAILPFPFAIYPRYSHWRHSRMPAEAGGDYGHANEARDQGTEFWREHRKRSCT